MVDLKKNKADIVAVALAAKVSISTVSRSYNHPELVKPATRKKIDAAVRKLGYIRNRAAQTIHDDTNSKSNRVYFLSHQLSSLERSASTTVMWLLFFRMRAARP